MLHSTTASVISAPDRTLTHKSIACLAGYDSGGLGRHLAEIVETTRQTDRLHHYYTPYPQANDAAGYPITMPRRSRWLKYTPIRYSPAWQNHLLNDWFDRAVARVLAPTNEFEGFGGQTLYSFQQARKLGAQILAMQAANSHVHNIRRQHQTALAQHPIESSWLNAAQLHKTLQEYALADVIYYASEYTKQSFLTAGIPESKLQFRQFFPKPRFTPRSTTSLDGRFRVVYSGSLTVPKGVPILIEAFSRLLDPDAELILVGGWATRGMKRYLQSWQARDRRIQICPGDPLPHLQSATVYVHPSYEDGFAYAPMEALACHVPVIVTEDTGMKTYIKSGINGYIVPTGDWRSLLDCLITCQTQSFSWGTV
jgi:glycosyltransferase involved in cell wall biosynthesis